jgi:hypothetical protein
VPVAVNRRLSCGAFQLRQAPGMIRQWSLLIAAKRGQVWASVGKAGGLRSGFVMVASSIHSMGQVPQGKGRALSPCPCWETADRWIRDRLTACGQRENRRVCDDGAPRNVSGQQGPGAHANEMVILHGRWCWVLVPIFILTMTFTMTLTMVTNTSKTSLRHRVPGKPG